MQINGRLQLQLKVSDKDYNLEGNLQLNQKTIQDIEHQADEMAERIMARVRQRSKAKSATKITIFKDNGKSSTGIHQKSESQSDEFKMRDMENNKFMSELKKSNLYIVQEERKPIISQQEIKTPLKSKSISTMSMRKESTQKKLLQQNRQGNYYLAESQLSQHKVDGKQLIQMIDNVQSLVKKTSTVLTHKHSSIQDTSKMDNSKSQLTIKPAYQTPIQKLHKDDIVSQLLGSLKNAKRLKDEYTKKYL